MTEIQDILIILSAGASVVKTFLSVGIYSYFHVVFAIAELALTGVAFALVLLDDDFSRERLGDQNHLTFLLAFCSGIMAEWIDVIGTYMTVRLYKKLKYVHPDPSQLKKEAARCFAVTAIFGMLFVGIIPIIALSKADWDVDYFEPAPFNDPNSERLFIAACIGTASSAFSVLLYTCFPAALGNGIVACLFAIVTYPASLTASILTLITLAKIDNPAEAGSLTFLACINAIQGIELSAELSRLGHLRNKEMELENKGGDDQDDYDDIE